MNIGKRSSSQDVLGDDKSSLETSVSEAGLNTGKSILQRKA